MSNTTTDARTQLALWLEQHRQTLSQGWQTQASGMQEQADTERVFSTLFDGLLAAAQERYALLDEALAQVLTDASALHSPLQFPELIQLLFHLRAQVADLLAVQERATAQSLPLLLQFDPLLERAVLSLSRLYSQKTEAELQQKIEQAEFLASRQALLAEEADRAALRITTLYEIARQLSSSLDRELLLTAAGTQLRDALQIDDCAIWLVDQHQPTLLRCERAWGAGWAALHCRELLAPQWPPHLQQPLAERQLRQIVVGPAADEGDWAAADTTIVAVPLTTPKTTLGVLALQLQPNTAFGRDERRLVQAIGTHTSVALENAHLYGEIRAINADLEQKVAERARQLQQERDRLQLVFEISHYVTGTLEIDDLLQRTLQALSKLAGVSHGSVMLLEPDTGHLVDRAVLNGQNHEPGYLRFQLGEGVAGWIAQHRQPVLVDDVRSDARWVARPPLGDRPQKTMGSLIGVPLIASDEIVGVLMLSHPEPGHFDQDQLLLLNAIASEIAIAIYNAQLYGYLNERAERFGAMLRRHEEEASKINAILQSLTDGVIVSDNQGSVLLANLAAQHILERPLDELLSINMTLASLLRGLRLPPGILDPVVSVVNQPLLPDGRLNTITATMERGHRTLSVHLGPVLTERGETLGAVAIVRDITREVESDRIKSEFIATVSHELRTPMTSIKGYTQLLPMLGAMNESQREFLSTIASNADRMIAIINDLLDITKVETGSVDLNIQPLHFAEVLGAIIAESQPAIVMREHNLSLNLQPGLPLVLADHTRLNQVLHNLLSNAIKYTPRGGQLSVGAHVATGKDLPPELASEFSDQRQWILISVQDSGVGIAPEEQAKIFERFYRTDNPLKVEAGGTGLGLTLVRGLVELLGGRIWVESELGKGTTFHMILPIAPNLP